MSNRIFVCSGGLALLLPALLGLSCLRRDWDVCAANAPCKPGYTCTADWRCVLSTDAGSDGLVVVDSQGSTDAAGSVDGLVSAVTDGASGPASGQDARGFDSAPTSAAPDGPVSAAPDGPAAVSDAPAVVPDAPAAVSDAPAALPEAPRIVPDAPPAVPDAPATVPDGTMASLPDARPVDSSPDVAAPDTAPPVDAPGSCSTDRDCLSPKPLCLANQCAKCSTDNDCAGRPGAPACAPSSGLCVACTANRHCTGAAGICDTATNQCTGCVTRDDCGGACQTCSSGGVCTAVRNQDDPGRCPGTCDSTGACKSKQGQTCLTVASGCAGGTTCSPDGVCCDTACGQACHSCLGSKTGGKDGTCATVSDGTGCGASGQYCSAGTCTGGCLISGTFYPSGAVSSTNPCQTCQPSSSATSWSQLGNGTGCGSGQICNGGNCQAGCWISGNFVGSGATESGNTCLVCNPAKSTSGWANNDAATAVPCGGCGGTATCVSGALGPCSKTTATYYRDADGDGYGNRSDTTSACTATTGYVSNPGDCDDTNGSIYPGYATCSGNDRSYCDNDGSFKIQICDDGCLSGSCRSDGTIGKAGWVSCGTVRCTTTQGCSWDSGGSPTCGTANNPSRWETCDGPNDCASGQVCCSYANAGGNSHLSCYAGSCPPSGMNQGYTQICDPLAPVCPTGQTCSQNAFCN